MAFLVFTNIDAFAKIINEDEFSVSYANIVSSNTEDKLPTILLDIKPRAFTDFEFQVAISSALLELENSSQKKSSFINRVALWMNYRF